MTSASQAASPGDARFSRKRRICSGSISSEISRPVPVTLPPHGTEGLLGLPEGRAQGLVRFAHGSGSSRLSPRNMAVAEVLQQAGLATLLFDLLASSHRPG